MQPWKVRGRVFGAARQHLGAVQKKVRANNKGVMIMSSTLAVSEQTLFFFGGGVGPRFLGVSPST